MGHDPRSLGLKVSYRSRSGVSASVEYLLTTVIVHSIVTSSAAR